MVVSRRSGRNKNTSFSDGDLVEIHQDNGVASGRLLHKLSSTVDTQPRWLVAIDDSHGTQREVLEAELSHDTPKPHNPTTTTSDTPHKHASVRTVSTSSLSVANDKKKIVSFDTIASDSSTSKELIEQQHVRKGKKKRKGGVKKPTKAKTVTIPANATCIEMRTGTLVLQRGPGKRRVAFIFKV